MNRFQMARFLAANPHGCDGWWAAIKYLFGRYPLADWEIELILSPSQQAPR